MLLAATLLRRHFFLLHLLFLALAALAAARLASAWVGSALGSAPALSWSAPATGAAPTALASAASAERDFAGALGASMFGVEPVPGPDAPILELAHACADADPTALPLRLVGAAVFADPSLGLASIVLDEGSGAQAQLFAVGELIGEQARVVAIDPEQACIENLQSGAFELVSTKAPVRHPSASSSSGARSRERASSSARPAGPTGDPVLDELITGARATPRFEGGKLAGVKLSAVKRDSWYTEVGLKSGDVVVAVDGYSPQDPGHALELWAKLRERSTVELSVLRQGKPLSLTVPVPRP